MVRSVDQFLQGPVIKPLIERMKQNVDEFFAGNSNNVTSYSFTPHEYRVLREAIDKIAYAKGWYPYPIARSFSCVYTGVRPHIDYAFEYHTDISDIGWILDWIYRDPTMLIPFRIGLAYHYLPERKHFKRGL
jgi:hypothetical protein